MIQQRRRRFVSLLFLGGGLLLFTACSMFNRVVQIPAPTQAPALTNTPEPSPTTAGLPGARSTQPQEPGPGVIYYYFVELESQSPPAGSVVILQDELVLGPTPAHSPRGPDPAANIQTALQAMLADPRNAWESAGVNIQSIAFRDGDVNLSLEGEYFAPGDIVLIAARMQILLTVFVEAPVQTATILLNGENIANLGISHSRDARPAGYAFSRAEVEAYMSENAARVPAFNLEGIWQENAFMAGGWAGMLARCECWRGCRYPLFGPSPMGLGHDIRMFLIALPPAQFLFTHNSIWNTTILMMIKTRPENSPARIAGNELLDLISRELRYRNEA